MRNAALHHRMETYAVDAAGRLCAATAAGQEIPFELLEQDGSGPVPLFHYRPLTDRFIAGHRDGLRSLSSHEEAARALAECEALDVYLAAHGEVRIPAERFGCAELALEAFLRSVYHERTDFGFEPAHFEAAYGELERTVYAAHGCTTVIAPVLGIGLDAGTTELTVGDGLSLIRGDALAGAPSEAVWSHGEEPSVLAVLTVAEDRSARGAVAMARTRFRRVLSALRLLERGTYAVGPMAWARSDSTPWRTVPLGIGARAGGVRLLTIVTAAQEEELRAFCRLIGRRGFGTSGENGELGWALSRFEMGCERPAPFEALTDYLLALRALLEPEGPASGRLAQRLAVICAQPEDRVELARRTARAVALERAIITGMATGEEGGRRVDALVDELAGHLRAILRDALCGHLDTDLCGVADDLLAEAAEALSD